MAMVQRPRGQIKSGGKVKCFLREATMIKAESVSWKGISITDQNP
jgi:hypothetical protein